MPTFSLRSALAAPAARVFGWHKRAGALERLTPPWMPVKVLERRGGISPGSRVVLDVPAGPFTTRWVIEHRDYIEGRQFRDVQLSGPFSKWSHLHLVEPAAGDTSVLEDRIEFDPPLGALGAPFYGAYIRRSLARTFRYRHELLAADLVRHAKFAGRGSLRIVVTGSSGLIGNALVPYLTTAGHTVVRLTRSHGEPGAGDGFWDPARQQINPTLLEGADAVIHLAGESVGQRWTSDRKERIRESRMSSTTLLARTIAGLARRPSVMIVASAIGYYGDRGREQLDDASSSGSGFLAGVVRDWEAAASPARAAGVRVVNTRFGVVLDPRGGALARMLPPFRAGVGGHMGDGAQWMSWIALDDLLGAIEHALFTDSLGGAVNLVAPEPVTGSQFADTLGAVLHRPAAMSVPAFALKLAFGEMAEETILASQRVAPKRLAESGFQWRLANLESALRDMLGASPP